MRRAKHQSRVPKLPAEEFIMTMSNGMEGETWLGGRVVRQRLALFDGPPPPDAAPLKRANLSQGAIAQVHQGEPGMRYIAWVELRPGGVRGNHYHEHKEEHLYLVTGVAELGLLDRETREQVLLRLVAGDLVVIRPGVAHAVRTLEAGHAIEFAPEALLPGDTYRHVVLEQQG